MTATRDLISASISAADELENIYCDEGAALREACARAMVQPAAPDMAEVERLLEAYDHEYASGGSVEDYDRARAALLDYVRDHFGDADKMVQPVSEVPMPEVAYLYTLEYGSTVADTKVSVQQLNYPFGVCGADYLWRNEDGISYVRQTPLYTAAPQPVGDPCRVAQPAGWRCTRTGGHEGPCAAVEDRA